MRKLFTAEILESGPGQAPSPKRRPFTAEIAETAEKFEFFSYPNELSAIRLSYLENDRSCLSYFFSPRSPRTLR